MPKNKKTWMIPNNYSDEDFKAINWCIDNNIIISPMKKGDKYKIGIALYDHRNVKYDKFEYEEDQVWDKVLEYSKYYYDKNS